MTDVPSREKIPRLLLTEDDPTTSEVVGMMLQRHNYSLDLAEDGQKAVEMWEKGGYDLVLMDIQMPRLNGIEATRAIREKERERGGHTPIVAVTAHSFKEDVEMYLSLGMDAHISKPIDFKKCLQVIAELINQKANG
jgi:CheY-like chemotaxis protein